MDLTQSLSVYPKLFGHQTIDSTNLELGRLELSSLPEFTAVIAAEQTAGSGRLGRNWSSPLGASLSISVLVRPTSMLEISWLTLLAGLSVARAIGVLGVDAGIKWPNDVLVEGKKICGILAVNRGPEVILGIGINLKTTEDQLTTATALDEHGAHVSLDALAKEVGAELQLVIGRFRLDPESVMAEFRARCVTLGQAVRAEFPDGSVNFGTAESVNHQGQLVILTPEPLALSAADVWHLRN